MTLLALGLAGAGTLLLFIFASGTAWLFFARLLSGFAVGVAAGTCAAWLAELYAGEDKSRATLAASGANMVGLAIGHLLAGVLSQYARWALDLSFIVYLLALAVIGRIPARTSWKPHFRLVNTP